MHIPRLPQHSIPKLNPAPRFSAGPELPHMERIEAAFETVRPSLAISATDVKLDTLQVLNKPLHLASITTDLATKEVQLQAHPDRVAYFITGDSKSGLSKAVSLLTFAKDKATNYWKFASAGAGRNLDILFKRYKTYSVAHPEARIIQAQGLPGQPTGFIQALMIDEPDVAEILETPGSAFPNNPPNPGYPLEQGDRMNWAQFRQHLQTIAKR